MMQLERAQHVQKSAELVSSAFLGLPGYPTVPRPTSLMLSPVLTLLHAAAAVDVSFVEQGQWHVEVY
jgi:hypothetical protein